MVSPLYLRVDVETAVFLTSLEGSGEVEQAIQQELDRFLHPLTGGSDGAGVLMEFLLIFFNQFHRYCWRHRESFLFQRFLSKY